MTQEYDLFKDFIMNESPQKMKGDAPFPEEKHKLSSISKRGINDKYILLKSDFIIGLDLYTNDNDYYIIGEWYFDDTNKKERFAVINELSFELTTFYSNQKQLNNKQCIIIDTLHTHKDWLYNGISSALYKYIIQQGYIIISDKTQYEGAVNLWKKFPSVSNSVVYIYDIEEDKIISKYTENTPESQVWSDNKSKEKIRLVFTKK
jgi:hypothetical protein